MSEHSAQPAAAGASHRRPEFASSYPRTEELDALLETFADGDYRAVRRGATTLAKRSDDPAVRDAVQDLLARLDPDRLTTLLFLLPVGLLAILVAHYLLGSH